MLTEKFFFLQKTSFYVIPAVDYHNNWKEHQSRKKIQLIWRKRNLSHGTRVGDS